MLSQPPIICSAFGRYISVRNETEPQSALELGVIAETRITDEDVQALHQMIAVLCECIQRTAADLAAIALTRHARMLVGATTR